MVNKGIIGLGTLIISLASVSAATAATNEPEIIIKFNDARLARREQVVNDYGLKDPKQLWRSTKGLATNNARTVGIQHIYSVTVPASTNVDALLDGLNADPRIEYAEPNSIISTDATPNDPSFSTLWGMHNTGQSSGTVDADIDAPEAWDITTAATIRVGVIDTGIDYTHPDLAANMWTNPGEIDGNGIDDDANGYVDDIRGWDFYNNDNDPIDDNGHGTHVAGTIGAVGNNTIGVTGVAWNAQLVAIKFLDSNGQGTLTGAIAALQYATSLGLPVTNNSWGSTSYSSALEDAVEAAGLAGQLVIAAAGNSGANSDVTPHYPAAYTEPAVVSVASTTRTDTLSSFSNYGAISVDLGAPGSSIYSTYFGGGYATMSGTSMATPHVTGAAALLWSAAPQATAQQIKQMLMQEGDAITALNGVTVSGRRLNIANALNDIPVAALVTPANGETDAAVTLDASGSTDDDGIVSYTWTFGDTTTATTTTPTVAHTYPSVGTYAVTVTVNDGVLDSAPATGSTVIAQSNRAPVAMVSSGPYSAETNRSITMDGSGSSDADGDALTYHWNFGDTAVTDTTTATTTHAYSAAGSYTVQLTVDDGEDTSPAVTTTATITDPPPPAPAPIPTPEPTPEPDPTPTSESTPAAAPAEEPTPTLIPAPEGEKEVTPAAPHKKKKHLVVRRARYNKKTHELTVVVAVQKTKGEKVTVRSKRFGAFTFKKKKHLHVLRKTIAHQPKRLRLRASNGLRKTIRFK